MTILGAPAHADVKRRRPTRTRSWVVSALAIGSGLGAALSGASPTGHGVADVVWTVAFGASLALAAADARRWTWFLVSAVGLAVAAGPVALPAAVAAAAATAWLSFAEGRRRRWMGALVGLLAAQAIVRGRSYGFTGLPTLVAAAACIPMYWSALAHTSRRARRIAVATLTISAVVIGLLAIFTMVSAAEARSRVVRAIDFGDDAVAAAERGDQELAAVLIDAAGDELRAIAEDFDQIWLSPGRVVPVLGQHSRALRTMADAGAEVAARGALVLDRLDADELLPGDGQVDMEQLDLLIPAVEGLFDAVDGSRDRIDDIDLTWIVGPAASRIEDLRAEVAALDGPVADARTVTDLLPGMLGRGGDRRYLVVFMTPVELRAAGGFAGNWAEIEVANGAITVADAGRGDDLNRALGPGGAVLPEPERYALYDGFRVNELFQNLPLVADFTWVAEAAAAFYEQATGRQVDAVIGVDIEATVALAGLSGPVEVDGEQLSGQALEDFLVTGQYERYDTDNDGRIAALDDLTRSVFSNLTSGALPSAFDLESTVSPLVAGNHLQIVSVLDAENESLTELGATGAFPANEGQDLLAVISQNVGENKIDSLLQRDIRYQVLYDEASGRAQATLTVTLTNDAPAEGLPQAIIGNNDQGLPFGTNAMRLQIHSPLEFRNALLDDEFISMTLGSELGWGLLQLDLLIPPGATRELRLDLEGTLDLSAGYLLDVHRQPVMRPDNVTVDIRRVGAGSIQDIRGWDGPNGTTVSLVTDRRITVSVGG